MQPGERRAKERALLRTKILDAARSLFAKEGYQAVTMRQIAAKIGYTATALYYHFPDKESLLRELCDTDFLALRDYFKKLGRIHDPMDRIRKLAGAYVHFGLDHPQQYRLMFMTPHPQPRQSAIEKGNPDEDSYALLRQAVEEAMLAGCFREAYRDPEIVAQALWASMHGLVALHLIKNEDDWVPWRSADATGKLLGEILLRGLSSVSI